MDPFKHFSSTEGRSSSESGWTRYIASPTQDNDFECSEDDYDNNHNIKDDGEGNSDDSMASDASSAPSYHHQYKHKDGKGQSSHSNAHVKHDKGDYTSKHSSRKEAKKVEKKSAESSGKSKTKLGGQAKNRK